MMEVYTPPKIVFPHIMKTGGTTVNNYLQGFFHEHDVLYDASTYDELNALTFEDIQKTRFVRGHFEHSITDYFGPHNGFEIIGLLRNPAQRVLSQYWHMMKAPDIDPAYNFIRERNLSFEEFVHAPECAFLTSNYQVNMYGSNERVGAETKADKDTLRKAKEYIDRCCVVGVTEELDTFTRDLANYFGFASTPQTLGKTRSYSAKTEISGELMKTVERMNALDIELYQYAQREIPKKRKASQRRKITPLATDKKGFLRWYAHEPFSGSGWGDLQRAEIRHRWSLDSTASLDVSRNYSGSLLGFMAIDRFVSDEQEEKLSVYIDNNKVNLRRIDLQGQMGRFYFFQVPPSRKDHMEMRFELDHLISFAQVDPNSTSHMPRGLAMIGIGFDPFD